MEIKEKIPYQFFVPKGCDVNTGTLSLAVSLFLSYFILSIEQSFSYFLRTVSFFVHETTEEQRNGPFAASGHMVQNPPCWRASYPLGHPKQRKCKFGLMKSLCFGCPSGQLALQHGGFCTM